MSRSRLAIFGALLGAALALAAPVAASRPTSLYYFYDCTGDGPSSFYAVKTDTQAGHPSAGSAFAVTDGSGTYQILSYGEGLADPPGIRSHSKSYNLVCQIDFAQPIGTTTVYGYFAWT